MNEAKKKLRTLLALLAFICAVFFTATIIFVHIATEDLTLLSDTLSRYTLDKNGFVLELGFYAIGLTQLLLACLLFGHAETKPAAASVFLMLSSLGVIAVAFFPTLPPPATVTERLPHILGAVMQFLCFPLAALTLAPSMNTGPRKTYTLLTGSITGLLFILILGLFVLPSMRDFSYFGLIEKVDILTINLWLIFMSFTLYKTRAGEL
jgi:hypothetical membrane protein